MGIARKWVFPIIRIVVLAAVAVALVKLAFFPSVTEAAGPEFPTGEIIEPQVPVAIGTIRNDVVLDGTVEADAAVPVKATLAGEVRQVSVTLGQWVEAGTEMMQIRGFNEDGTTRWSIVTSPNAGTLSSFSVLVGQQVSVGDSVGQVAPPTFSVTGTLAPEQRYRLLNQPTEAQVTITGGPAPFTCTGLAITTALAGAGDGESGGETGSGSGTSVRCAVPAGVRVFAGLAAQLTIAGGLAENVLVVPMTSVEGAADTGIVYVIGPDGASEPREVTLGINDGVSVEIAGGLAEGEMILQFVPGAAGPDVGFPVDGGPVVETSKGG